MRQDAAWRPWHEDYTLSGGTPGGISIAVLQIRAGLSTFTVSRTRTALARGLSLAAVDGRIPVDASVDMTPDFSAEPRRILAEDAANQRISRWNPRCSSDYAFSPTGNSAILKGTPHPPIPQYPFGFFARYCW